MECGQRCGVVAWCGTTTIIEVRSGSSSGNGERQQRGGCSVRSGQSLSEMEDGGTNVKSLVPAPNLNSEDGSKREEEEEVEVEEGVEKVKEEDVGKEDKDSGGLINNFISFITPLSPRTEKPSQHGSNVVVVDDDDGEKGGVDGCGERGGGVIRKMVSSFFHQRVGEGEGEGVVESEEEEIMAAEKVKRLKTENGGIIHDIASHLPASVPDGAVPTADEATFLINSLVRD
ncbi:hypothetical protein VNO80_07400 [Phaseolus coccineus]|uniref:Uncharacterized protein n=1 Tax=Phaseolus coccineus TaxID=3886 RepID=A0AAN9NJM8_PHACN